MLKKFLISDYFSFWEKLSFIQLIKVSVDFLPGIVEIGIEVVVVGFCEVRPETDRLEDINRSNNEDWKF